MISWFSLQKPTMTSGPQLFFLKAVFCTKTPAVGLTICASEFAAIV